MNVIWVISDTLRKDHLGCYGNEWIHTPSLDAFSRKATLFERHYAGSFPTMPARADFLTGKWTGCFMNWEPLPKDQQVVPQILKENKIRSAAVVDTPFYLRNQMNYDRGFTSFYEIPGQRYRGEGPDVRGAWRTEADRFAPRTFTKAMEWLERHYKEQFFLWIDTWDPHEPWEPPEYYTELYWDHYDGENIMPIYTRWQERPELGVTEEKVKKAHACYAGEVTMVDTWFGYLLRRLENMGLMENTAIIFTTDHGFYFGEHGGMFGKLNESVVDASKGHNQWEHSPFYEHVIANPLMVYVPGATPGTYGKLTSAIDLAPTVLDLLELDAPKFMEGRSLVPAIKDPSVDGPEFVVSGPPITNRGSVAAWIDDNIRSVGNDSNATVTTEEWTLLYSTDPGLSELYHLPSDPLQENNVIGKHPDVAKDLHKKFVAFLREKNVAEPLIKPRLELR